MTRADTWGELLSGEGGEVGEVEAEPVGLHQGAGLVDMVAQDLAQGGVQQVGGGVGTHDGLTAVGVHLSLDGVSQLEHASGQLAGVHILAALVLLHVSDLEGYAAHAQRAVVGGLAAHLGIEGGLVQHHDGLHAGHELLGLLVLHHQGHHLGVVNGGVVIAHKLGLGHILAELHAGPAQIAQGLPGLPGALALLVHLIVELRLVQLHALLLHHLQGQVDGEAVGVIQLKGVGAGEGALPLWPCARRACRQRSSGRCRWSWRSSPPRCG